MSDKSIQEEIKEINRKLDLILEDAAVQRQNRESVNDLMDDVAVIGKDAFGHMVVELDDAGIEVDGEIISDIAVRLLRNIDNIGDILNTLESFSDLTKDITPIVKQVGLDGVQKFYEFEQKGYFEVLNQIGLAIDTIVSRYSKDDMQKISVNLVKVFDTLSIVSDEKVLEKIDSIFSTLREINIDDVEDISIWRMVKDLNKPEVKKSIGFMMAFLEIINENNNNKSKSNNQK